MDLQTHFWWKQVKYDVIKFVKRCFTCQQVKAERKQPGGLIQSLEVLQWNESI